MSSGTFIVLEGPDGSGTTTHAKLLGEHLKKNHQLLQTAEPTSGPIGQFIRQQLRGGTLPSNALQMLFSADRAWHVENVVEPALSKGQVVLSDRYAPSTLIYGEALGLDPSWLHDLNKNFIQPDLLFVLLPPFEVCQKRLGARKEKEILETDSLQKRVHALYDRYVQSHPSVIFIDSSGDIGVTAKQLADACDKFLAK